MKAKSDWAKSVRRQMIDRDMSVNDLAKSLGLSREYVSSVINERVISTAARRTISDFLDVPYIND